MAGDNPERLKSEASLAALCGVSPLQASSGKTVRHRLNRGGDRSANNALWTIAMVRMRSDPRTRAYVDRRTKEGMSKKEIHRCLKRYLVREVYPLLLEMVRTQRWGLVVEPIHGPLHAQTRKLAESGGDGGQPVQPPVPGQTPNRKHRCPTQPGSRLESPRQPRQRHDPVEVHTSPGTTQASLHNYTVKALGAMTCLVAALPESVSQSWPLTETRKAASGSCPTGQPKPPLLQME